MKKSLIYLFSFALMISFFSCNDELVKTLEDEYVGLSAKTTTLRFLRVGDGQAVDAGIKAVLIAAQKSAATNFTFEVDPTSTAVEGTHYTIGGNSASIPANESFANLPIQIIPDGINPGEKWSLIIKLISSDLKLASSDPVTYNMEVTCPSNLAGTINYESVGWCGNTASGSVEFVVDENEASLYSVIRPDLEGDAASDAAMDFGAYDACYGPGATLPGGNLKLRDVCNKISHEGASRWGEVYTFDEVSVSSDNMQLTLVWHNDYDPEAGTAVLTRADGAAWPNLTN